MLEDVNNFSEDDSPSLNELKCSYTPGGETVFECIQECMKSSDTNNCNEKDCNEKCRNCMNLKCRWNVVDYNEQRVLNPIKLKLKLLVIIQLKLWIRPFQEVLFHDIILLFHLL